MQQTSTNIRLAGRATATRGYDRRSFPLHLNDHGRCDGGWMLELGEGELGPRELGERVDRMRSPIVTLAT